VHQHNGLVLPPTAQPHSRPAPGPPSWFSLLLLIFPIVACGLVPTVLFFVTDGNTTPEQRAAHPVATGVASGLAFLLMLALLVYTIRTQSPLYRQQWRLWVRGIKATGTVVRTYVEASPGEYPDIPRAVVEVPAFDGTFQTFTVDVAGPHQVGETVTVRYDRRNRGNAVAIDPNGVSRMGVMIHAGSILLLVDALLFGALGFWLAFGAQ
jgi:hypothetical protein